MGKFSFQQIPLNIYGKIDPEIIRDPEFIPVRIANPLNTIHIKYARWVSYWSACAVNQVSRQAKSS